MTIYADILVIVNFYIDFILLMCVKKFLGLSAKTYRLVLGGLAGAFLSLLALIDMPDILMMITGLLTSLIISAAAFLPLRPGVFFRAAICLFAFSMLLSGFFLFLLRLVPQGKIAVFGSVIYFPLSLPALFVFTLVSYVVFALLRRLLPRRFQDGLYRKIRIENNGAAVTVYAKADTGNSLKEPFSGLPVIVCHYEKLLPVLPENMPVSLSDGEIPQGGGFRVVPFEAVGGGGILPAFRPEKVIDEKTGGELSCFVASSSRPLSSGQYDCVFDPEILN